MYMTKNKLFTLIFVLCFGTSIYSQIKFNEYSCANISTLTDASGNTPDWFELYNSSLTNKNIGGYYVSNDPTNLGKWQFPINTTILADSFLVVYASGLDTVITGTPNEYHTNFNLLQTKGEKLFLSDVTGTIKDTVTIRRHQHNHSWAKMPNGSGTWKIFPTDNTGTPTSTPGARNTGNGYIAYLPTPTLSLSGGFYQSSVQVSISAPQTSAVILENPAIYYTGANFYDGANPSALSTTKRFLFDGTLPINIDSTTVIRAYLDTNTVFSGYDYLPSFVETNTFFINNSEKFASNGLAINTDFTLPVVSIAYDTLAVGSFPGGLPLDPKSYMVSVEYFDKSKNLKLKTVGAAYPVSADDNLPSLLGGINYQAEDEFGYSYTNKVQFYTDGNLASSSRSEQTAVSFRAAADDKFPYGYNPITSSFSTHMRDAMAQTYAMKSGYNLDGSHYQPCIMYLNGKYWGVYEIREVFDAEYVKQYYSVDPDKAEALIKDGALQGYPTPDAQFHWGNLVTFITTNNMANDSLRGIADSLLDFNSLMDLIIYNSYIANGEFPTKSSWWRFPDTLTNAVKWRYHMTDMDNSFGLNKPTAISTYPDASNCQYGTLYGSVTDSSMAHLAIFESLMVSDTFKSHFINRYSYLLNTTLKCAPIIDHLTYIRNLLRPEMAQHCYLWGQNDTIWSIGVDTMKYWINQRCLGLRDDIKQCYAVTGPFDFCTDIFPVGAGSITLNTNNYPEYHTDTYFANVYFDAIAIPDSNYYFDHWEPTSFTLPSNLLTNDTIQWKFTTASCLKAVFRLKEPYNLIGEPIVPTGFSPNGDGNNDLLNVYGTLHVSEFSLDIYNRWGEQVFSSTDKTKGWDGNYKGVEAPVGVYAYSYRVIVDGKIIQKSGSITLIR